MKSIHKSQMVNYKLHALTHHVKHISVEKHLSIEPAYSFAEGCWSQKCAVVKNVIGVKLSKCL